MCTILSMPSILYSVQYCMQFLSYTFVSPLTQGRELQLLHWDQALHEVAIIGSSPSDTPPATPPLAPPPTPPDPELDIGTLESKSIYRLNIHSRKRKFKEIPEIKIPRKTRKFRIAYTKIHHSCGVEKIRGIWRPNSANCLNMALFLNFRNKASFN